MSAAGRSIAHHLIDFLKAETGGLSRNPHYDLTQSNLQKTQLLLELNRSIRVRALEENLLAELKTALTENACEIENQLTAIRELTNIILDTLRRERDDGTYTHIPAGTAVR